VGRYVIKEIKDHNPHVPFALTKTNKIATVDQMKQYGERLKPHNLSKIQKDNLYYTGNIDGRVST
jgi:hypothetical protein